MPSQPRILILGTRGIPANHGGFETFAERLSLFLAERGWAVSVYCQEDVLTVTQRFTTATWRGIERVVVQVADRGPFATVEFDWHAARHAAKRDGVVLMCGYNTAAFIAMLRLAGKKVLTNMDGIEWQRSKWSRPVKWWLYANEWLGAWLSNRLVADHPAIADHLATRRSRKAIVTILYGADEVKTAPAAPVEAMGLRPGNYLISIARIGPDNTILPMVAAFSRRRRGAKLVVLGRFNDKDPHHNAIKAAASDEVVFPGPIYDKTLTQALRFHARAYCHGHTAGGTNPSLLESLWCGNAVLAHRNRFNVWTAGPDQFFFGDEDECDAMMGRIFADDAAVERAKKSARTWAATHFNWDSVLRTYEQELLTLGGYAPVIREPRIDMAKAAAAE
jgi:glycosyltransferase involved in cell wall biosynthesis